MKKVKGPAPSLRDRTGPAPPAKDAMSGAPGATLGWGTVLVHSENLEYKELTKAA